MTLDQITLDTSSGNTDFCFSSWKGWRFQWRLEDFWLVLVIVAVFIVFPGLAQTPLCDGIMSFLLVCKRFWLIKLKIAKVSVVLAFKRITVSWIRTLQGLMHTKAFSIRTRLTDIFWIHICCFYGLASRDYSWDETWVKIFWLILGVSWNPQFSSAFARS